MICRKEDYMRVLQRHLGKGERGAGGGALKLREQNVKEDSLTTPLKNWTEEA